MSENPRGNPSHPAYYQATMNGLLRAARKNNLTVTVGGDPGGLGIIFKAGGESAEVKIQEWKGAGENDWDATTGNG